MNQAQQSTKTLGAHGRADVFGRALLIAVVIVAVATAAILATSWIAGSPSRSSVGTQVSPLSLPELIEFRRGERGMAATQVDPLSLPELIEFRRGERGMAATQVDPLRLPELIEFRRGERGIGESR
jgi:hypothetical protein